MVSNGTIKSRIFFSGCCFALRAIKFRFTNHISFPCHQIRYGDYLVKIHDISRITHRKNTFSDCTQISQYTAKIIKVAFLLCFHQNPKYTTIINHSSAVLYFRISYYQFCTFQITTSNNSTIVIICAPQFLTGKCAHKFTHRI